MEGIEATIAQIKNIDENYFKKAQNRLREQARPKGSLGVLEDLAAKMASIKSTLDVKLTNKVMITCAGDHGIVEEGVSLFPSEVTKQMVLNFVNQGASINVFARHAGAKVIVGDFGVNCDFDKALPIYHKKIGYGTKNFLHEKAMTRKEAIKSIKAGISVVEELQSKEKIDIIGTGDMGIGNTTSSTAIIASLSGHSLEELTGRGAGLDDKGLQKKINVIKKALALHKPDKKDPIDILSKVGGFEIGAIAGIILGAAAYGIPVVIDGFISSAGALLAYELSKKSKDYLFSSHNSCEAGHKYMLAHLGLKPLFDFGFRLGEGTGACFGFEIIDLATKILKEIKTFEEVSINDAQT